MNRRQMLMLSASLAVAPSLLLAQQQATPVAAQAETRRDPYAPTEVAIRPDFEVGSIVVVSKDFFLYHVVAPAGRFATASPWARTNWSGRAAPPWAARPNGPAGGPPPR